MYAAAVLNAISPTGVKDVVLSGYSNEYLHYFTTPQEYEMQHYEGGHTVYGTWTSLSLPLCLPSSPSISRPTARAPISAMRTRTVVRSR